MLQKRGRGRVWNNHKGISPLIATVLLIAFAVSIGAMIMSWGKDAVTTGDCGNIGLEVQQFNNKEVFCYDTINQQIKLMVKNTGDIDVEQLRLRVIAQDYSVDEKIISDSRITSGGIAVKNIPYAKSGSFHVEIIPEVKTGSKLKTCSKNAIVSDALPGCY